MAVPETAPSDTPWTPGVRRGGLAAALAGPLGVAGVVYALLLIAGRKLLNDPDTYWHIAAGRWIWAARAVPTVDPFSHTMAGAPWHAHQWLAELILAGAHGAARMGGGGGAHLPLPSPSSFESSHTGAAALPVCRRRRSPWWR